MNPFKKKSKEQKNWEKYYRACKYYLTETVTREVTMEEFVQAERCAGFHRRVDDDQFLPATSGFGSGNIDGKVKITDEAMKFLKKGRKK
jgi:hypothetical protein